MSPPDWKDIQSEAPDNTGKAYLGPALNKTDRWVLSSKSHSSPPCSYPCPWASCSPPSLLSLTVPALFPSARLIFSGILPGHLLLQLQPQQGGKEKRNGVAGNGGKAEGWEVVHHWEAALSAKMQREAAEWICSFNQSRLSETWCDS